MKKLLMNFVLISLSIGLSHIAVAQSEEELQQAVESIEALTDDLGDNVEEIGENLEGLMEEHADELEAWAQEYSGQWEKWAEQFEHQFSRWAEVQEREWEDWAEQYSSKWEEWAEKIESEDFNPEEMNRLIQGNLKMLGEIPIGQMVDGMLKEGTDGLSNAPWDSLRDLQSMLQDSIEKSVAEAERKLAKSNATIDVTGEGIEDKTIEGEAEYILPVIKNQQDGIRAKQEIMADEARQALKKIERKLSEEDLDSDELSTLLQQLIEKSRAEKTTSADEFRSLAEKRELAKAAYEKSQKGRVRIQKQLERNQLENAQQDPRIVAERRLIEALERVRGDDQSTQSSRDALRRVYRVLEGEEQKIQNKNEELEDLRREIKQLREEVEKMKSNRNRDN